MEVNASAKHEHTGPYPHDWLPVTFENLFEFQNGVNADKADYGAGTQFINVLEVITHAHIREADIPGRVRLSEARQRSYAVQRGDVVFNRTSETQEEVGLAAVYEGDTPVVFGGFVIRGRPKSTAIDGRYAGYALRAHDVRRQIIAAGQGGIRANIGQGDLRKVVVHLPPVPEQQAIAQALSDIDDLIQSLERLIAKKRDLKQAAMQQLLTGQTRLPGFSGEWPKCTLGSIGTFTKGQGIRKDQVREYGLPCIRYGEIYTRHSDYIRRFYSFIDSGTAAESYRLKNGDLLFAGSGETAEEIGKCVAFVGSEEAYAGGDIVVLCPHGQESRFLGYLMNHPYVARQKARMGQGDAVCHIGARHLSAVTLRLPEHKEQTAIAEVLSDMDAEITALEARLAKTRDLKQGMMQELLTGRTRLV